MALEQIRTTEGLEELRRRVGAIRPAGYSLDSIKQACQAFARVESHRAVTNRLRSAMIQLKIASAYAEVRTRRDDPQSYFLLDLQRLYEAYPTLDPGGDIPSLLPAPVLDGLSWSTVVQPERGKPLFIPWGTASGTSDERLRRVSALEAAKGSEIVNAIDQWRKGKQGPPRWREEVMANIPSFLVPGVLAKSELGTRKGFQAIAEVARSILTIVVESEAMLRMLVLLSTPPPHVSRNSFPREWVDFGGGILNQGASVEFLDRAKTLWTSAVQEMLSDAFFKPVIESLHTYLTVELGYLGKPPKKSLFLSVESQLADTFSTACTVLAVLRHQRPELKLTAPFLAAAIEVNAGYPQRGLSGLWTHHGLVMRTGRHLFETSLPVPPDLMRGVGWPDNYRRDAEAFVQWLLPKAQALLSQPREHPLTPRYCPMAAVSLPEGKMRFGDLAALSLGLEAQMKGSFAPN